MKIKPADAERILARPDPAHVAILLYGPDEGLVRERGRALLEQRLGSPPDTMRLTDLTDADLKNDPARLADEACGLALIPGERLIRVRIGSESGTKAIESFLDGAADETLKPDALVVIEAGDLTPRSALRKCFESASNGVAIPCYADETHTLQALIDNAAREAGITVEPAAAQLLSSRLGNDRGVTIQELKKLFLYKQNDSSPVSMDDVMACLPMDTENMVGMLADRVCCGELTTMADELGLAFSTGLPPVAVLRGINQHFQRLHAWVAAVENGSSPEEILKKARPPIHFKRMGALRVQLRHWTRPDVERALDALLEAERQCKTTGQPDQLLAERVLLSLARRATRHNRAGRASAAR